MESSQIILCETNDCQHKVQAACFHCKNFYCFSCSLIHAKTFSSHHLHELNQSIQKIKQTCSNLLVQLKLYEMEIKKKKAQNKSKGKKNESKEYDQRLNPQKFQQQLNYINEMQKQTLKIVEKFFSELSLQLVNIWERYLEEFSNIDISDEKVQEQIQKIENFVGPYKQKTPPFTYVSNYFQQNFQQEVEQCRMLYTKNLNQQRQIPFCPEVEVSQKMLISLSELLCSELSTKNYQRPRVKIPDEKIYITQDDTLGKNVTYIPIFPIKKKICYLYNMKENSFQIQQFDKLDILPAFPKSIILGNGDLHIIGGANLNQEALNSHIVFRSNSSEVFKLSNLILPRNPVNGLISKGKYIYIIGGLNQNREWDRRCFSYSLQRKQWKQISAMISPKPHQSVTCFKQNLFCFGIPVPGKVNIEKFDLRQDTWKQINLTNFLCNPFNFSSGFSTIQINESQILFFGGKKFLENVKNKKRSTDREICPYMYIYQPQNNSFYQLGTLNPCIGVRDGEINPIIRNNKVYAVQYLISRNKPLCRWLSSLQMLEISKDGKAEGILLLHDD